jgi:hypothetical protein
MRAACAAVAGITLAWVTACGSTEQPPAPTPSAAPAPTPSATPSCAMGPPGPPSIASAFTEHLPRRYFVKEVCAADIGPGLDDVAGLSEFASGEVILTDSSPDGLASRALVGVAESGDGTGYVDAFLSQIGETRSDTVTLAGRTVRYFNTPAGEGYAFADGPTVVIGFIPPPQAGLDLAFNQEPAKEVFTRIMAAAAGTPIPVDDRPDADVESYAPARGRYTTPNDPGWVFFKTESVKGVPSEFCGIGPNGTVAGCDIVPAENAPSGVNQTVVDGSAPARYIYSATPTFTRDVDVLYPGHRIDHGDAACAMGYQGTVHCVIGDHSFVVSSQYGVLE